MPNIIKIHHLPFAILDIKKITLQPEQLSDLWDFKVDIKCRSSRDLSQAQAAFYNLLTEMLDETEKYTPTSINHDNNTLICIQK